MRLSWEDPLRPTPWYFDLALDDDDIADTPRGLDLVETVPVLLDATFGDHDAYPSNDDDFEDTPRGLVLVEPVSVLIDATPGDHDAYPLGKDKNTNTYDD